MRNQSSESSNQGIVNDIAEAIEIKESRELTGGWAKAYAAFEVVAKIAKDHPRLAEAAVAAACDTTLKITAIALNHIIREDHEKFHPEAVPLTESHRYRPYSKILEEGIEKFKVSHPETPVTWRRSKEYHGVADYLVMLRESKSNDPETPATELGHPLYELLEQVQHDSESFGTSTIRKYLPEEVSEVLDNSETAGSGSQYFKSVDRGWSVNPAEIKTVIEQEYAAHENKEPLSIADILPIFLKITGGKLDASLYLLTGFLKGASRENGGYVVFKSQEYQDSWFKKYILDEYSPVEPYQALVENSKKSPVGRVDPISKLHSKIFGTPEYVSEEAAEVASNYFDFFLRNQIGKPYHAANMAALLEILPPEGIVGLVSAEYIRFAPIHGANKALADVLILQDLRKVEKLFKNYEVAN